MTWTKISDTFGDDPVLLGQARGVRLLHVEGTVWCCKHETAESRATCSGA